MKRQVGDRLYTFYGPFTIRATDGDGRYYTGPVSGWFTEDGEEIPQSEWPELPEEVLQAGNGSAPKPELAPSQEVARLLEERWQREQAAEKERISISSAGNANNEPAANEPAEHVARPEPISGVALYEQHYEPLVFLVDEMIAKGYFAVAGGRPKSGKSWLELQKAQAIDTGRPFLGKGTRAGRVLYIALEDGERRVHQRLHLLNWKPKSAAFLFHIANFDGDGAPGPGLAQLEAVAADYDLIIIDTLVATLSGRANENDNVQMAAIVNELSRIAHGQDVAIVAIHHTGKGSSDDVFNMLRGASAIRGGYDLGLLLERKQGEREALLHVESRDFESSSMTIQQAEGGAGWEALGDGLKLSEIRAGRKAAEAMHEHGDALTTEELAKLLGVSRTSALRQLHNLEENGKVLRTTKQGETKPFDVWELVP